MSKPTIEIKRTDYQSMSPDALNAWVEKLSSASNNGAMLWDYWHAKSFEEKLLAAIVTDIRQRNQDQFPQLASKIVFSDSKKDLIFRDFRWNDIRVSRHGMGDWDAVLTAVLQEVAVDTSEDQERGQAWADHARALGVSLRPVEFTFREPLGSRGTVKTPYGPLDLTFGQDWITAPDGSWGGVPIAIVKDFVDIEDKSGKIHRVRGEEIHPHSGDLSKVLPVTKRISYTNVRFGQSFVEQDGKRFHALYRISGSRVAALSADGEKRTVEIKALTL